MVMPLLTRRHWTRDEVLALPEDGNRYELVDGELLVSPGPRRPHQDAVVELILLVAPYVKQYRLGRAVTSPADLDLLSGQLVQPDLFVEKRVKVGHTLESSNVGIPLLVVEVLSPSNPEYDRDLKRRLYQRSGVPAYWIVDLDARQVEVWTPRFRAPRIVRDRLTWQPDDMIEPLVIDLPEFFRQVWG